MEEVTFDVGFIGQFSEYPTRIPEPADSLRRLKEFLATVVSVWQRARGRRSKFRKYLSHIFAKLRPQDRLAAIVRPLLRLVHSWLRVFPGIEGLVRRGRVGAFTRFSGKAQEIHDYIVNSGRAGDWIGVAKSLVNRTDQYRPGKAYMRDVPDLKERLKAELSGAVAGANDHHWEEIADWLFDEAKPY